MFPQCEATSPLLVSKPRYRGIVPNPRFLGSEQLRLLVFCRPRVPSPICRLLEVRRFVRDASTAMMMSSDEIVTCESEAPAVDGEGEEGGDGEELEEAEGEVEEELEWSKRGRKVSCGTVSAERARRKDVLSYILVLRCRW